MQSTGNSRRERACNMPTVAIESTIPPSLIDALKKEGQSLSCPWLGLALGYLSPISFTMGHSFVRLEGSRWCEPTIGKIGKIGIFDTSGPGSFFKDASSLF